MNMAKILIVDDSSFSRNTLKYIVEKEGHTVVGLASDGDEALNFYRSTKPDIVTMDILMPRMDGIKALKQIMNYDPKAKVIIVSILSSKTTYDDAIKIGAAGYVAKPVKPDELLEQINKTLGSSAKKGYKDAG